MSFIPSEAERLALLTGFLGGIGWLFTKGLPALLSQRKASQTARLIRITRLERENGRLKRALLVLISAIELGVSVDRLGPHVRSARKLIDDSEAVEEKDALPAPAQSEGTESV